MQNKLLECGSEISVAPGSLQSQLPEFDGRRCVACVDLLADTNHSVVATYLTTTSRPKHPQAPTFFSGQFKTHIY